MKIFKLIYIIPVLAITIYSCEPQIEVPSASLGTSADFTKYISIGNSLTAGYSDGGLYLEAQEQSYPSIIASQINTIQSIDFTQPLMQPGSGSGYFKLAVVDGEQALSIVPPDSDWKTKAAGSNFHNCGVPGIRVRDITTAGYGYPGVNDYFSRMLPSGEELTTYLEYVTDQDPTFFTSWLGNNDVLGYATSGGAYGIAGDPTQNGLNGLTPEGEFTALYTSLINNLMSDGSTNGVLGTVPDITLIPFFTTVPFMAIPLDEATAGLLMSMQAFGGYNAALDGLVAAQIISPNEAAKRKVNYSAGVNPVLLYDKDLADLSQPLGSISPALALYGQTRQANASDLILFTSQSVLGTLANPSNPLSQIGIVVPLSDEYSLIPSEIANIQSATAAYNNAINSLATANNLGVFDSDLILSKVDKGHFVNGIMMTSEFARGGTFSLDGVHLTPRGYALVANEFIAAINKKFSSAISPVDISKYRPVIFP